MLKISFVILSIALVLRGCSQPKKVDYALLEHDKKELIFLTQAYKEGELSALNYIKRSCILREGISVQKELLGDGHTHVQLFISNSVVFFSLYCSIKL